MLIGGHWVASRSSRSGAVFNPSNGSIIARVPFCTTEEVDRAVRAAAAALPAWAETPVVERARVMFRFRELLATHAEELAHLVTREHGKTLAESRASIQRGVEMVEFACGVPSLIMGQSLANIARQVDCETIRHPVGVCAGITPFNFPAMVPLWMFPVAIICGNTFVLKPSEKVPLSAVRMGELLMESGLPEGVFNIVHGDKECVDALLVHPLVRAVSFVGSTAVARHVYETGTQNGKRVQAAGGAKNHLIIMPDADLDQAVGGPAALGLRLRRRAVHGGQRRRAGRQGRRCAGRAARARAAMHMKVGPTDGGADVDMGPVITREHLDRVAGYMDIGQQRRRRGRPRRPLGHAARRRLSASARACSISVEPTMRVAREEIFGPVLSVIRVDDLETALAIGRDCPYGNGASIFTRSGWAARQFKHHFNAGMIGINVGVPAPMAWFPFTGWNSSFFGDLHIQGTESVQFYTQQKMTMTRWFESPLDSPHDPVWKTGKG